MTVIVGTVLVISDRVAEVERGLQRMWTERKVLRATLLIAGLLNAFVWGSRAGTF